MLCVAYAGSSCSSHALVSVWGAELIPGLPAVFELICIESRGEPIYSRWQIGGEADQQHVPRDEPTRRDHHGRSSRQRETSCTRLGLGGRKEKEHLGGIDALENNFADRVTGHDVTALEGHHHDLDAPLSSRVYIRDPHSLHLKQLLGIPREEMVCVANHFNRDLGRPWWGLTLHAVDTKANGAGHAEGDNRCVH